MVFIIKLIKSLLKFIYTRKLIFLTIFILLVLYLFPSLLIKSTHTIFVLVLAGLALILLKMEFAGNKRENSPDTEDDDARIPRSTFLKDLFFYSIILIVGVIFIWNLLGITFGFGIIRSSYTNEEFRNKVFTGYKNLKGFDNPEAAHKFWGAVSDDRKIKRLSFTLGGTIYDRTGLLKNAFAYNDFKDNSIRREYLTSPGISSLIGRFQASPQKLSGIEGALRNEIFPDNFRLFDEFSVGRDLHLSFDSKLQDFCYKALKINGRQRRGSIVIMDPKSGDIYAMVSSPAEKMKIRHSGNISAKEKSVLDSLAYNFYAYQYFKPRREKLSMGSTIKPFIAALAIDEGLGGFKASLYEADTSKIPNTLINFEKTHIPRSDHKRKIDMSEALIKSRNFYFTQLIKKLDSTIGRQKIIQYFCEGLGFNQKILWNTNYEQLNTGFPLAERNAPSSLFAGKKLGLYKAALYNLGIGGQDMIEANVVHVAMMLSYLVNESYLPSPKIEIKRNEATYKKPGLLRESLRTVKKYMRRAVKSKNGTGHRLAKLKNISIGSKTGTSTRILSAYEVRKYKLRTRKPGLKKYTGYNSWNITFASPQDKPDEVRFVMVVVISDALKRAYRPDHTPPANEWANRIAVPVSEKIYSYMIKNRYFE